MEHDVKVGVLSTTILHYYMSGDLKAYDAVVCEYDVSFEEFDNLTEQFRKDILRSSDDISDYFNKLAEDMIENQRAHEEVRI